MTKRPHRNPRARAATSFPPTHEYADGHAVAIIGATIGTHHDRRIDAEYMLIAAILAADRPNYFRGNA